MRVASAPPLLFPPQEGAALHVGWTWFLNAVLATTFGGLILNIAEAESASPRLPSTLSSTLQEDVQFLQEETVVTAMRHEQPISESPSNIYVISAEDIRRSGATDIPTILRRVPGMEVMQTNGSEFNVSVRGNNQLYANKLLVLVDGRSIYEDGQALVFWKLIPVTLPEIQRIEVLKGPVGAVYGFNAFDGIVNIITKSPEEMKGSTLQFGGGEFGTVSSAAIHAGNYDNLNYRLSAGWDQNQKWRDRSTLGFRSYKFNLHGRYAFADSQLRVSGGLVDSNRFDTLSRTSLPENSLTQGYVKLAYKRTNFFVNAWWRTTHITSVNNTNPLLSGLIQTGLDSDLNPKHKFRGNTYNLIAQHTVDLVSSQRFSYGMNYRHNTVFSKIQSASNAENRLGVYLQNEWQATKILTTVAGLRFDLHSEINPTYSPRLAIIYRALPNHTVRATISLAYRPPTLLETNLEVRTVTMLPPPIPPSSPTTTVGSSNLKPERIISYDVGGQGWFFNHRLRIRADLFFNQISDLISFSDAGTAVNSRKADIYGGEAGVEFLATPWLTGFANYAYQDIRQVISGINRRAGPHFKVNGGFRTVWKNGLSGEATVHYISATTFPIGRSFSELSSFGATVPNAKVGSYTLLNLRGAYRFWNDRVEFAISVFNALNDRHKEHPLGDTIGSRVLGWLTVKL